MMMRNFNWVGITAAKTNSIPNINIYYVWHGIYYGLIETIVELEIAQNGVT